MMKQNITLGVEHFLDDHTDLLKGKRVALLAHAASINHQFQNTSELFFHHNDINLVKIFGPEHGLFGTAQDMESVSALQDPLTALPVVSLYGDSIESLQPKQSDLKDIDILVIDLQDVGSRYYTYIYTMALCMKVCGQMNIPVVVLDRPNPINGKDVEGNVLDPKYASFVGLYPLPVRHGMTIGELAYYFNDTQNFGAQLQVIPMKGWRREHYMDQVSAPWTPPSPNMPKLDTAIVYPGGCLLEATELSEGRGTTMPFEWVGDPIIDPKELSDALNDLNLKGVCFRPIAFKPMFQKHATKECFGVQWHVSDREQFRAYEAGLHFIKTVAELYPNDFAWRAKPYEFVKDIPAIDLLTGNDSFRLHLEGKAEFPDLKIGLKDFLEKRREHLIYK
ncbi:MAG: DUF1343 domain-containing protein [Deltaproteobacteria bacterium]|nr:DUF1343 domain-containing protein [Deltaproteobacteria bacterium]